MNPPFVFFLLKLSPLSEPVAIVLLPYVHSDLPHLSSFFLL
jgi:hypothetical protein